MIMTPDEAAKMPCPAARTFAGHLDPTCRGPGCIVWRWSPVSAKEPAFVRAIKGRMAEGHSHKDAVAWVSERAVELGVPTAPYRGWCGLGGEPMA